jgi:hypothetical protein
LASHSGKKNLVVWIEKIAPQKPKAKKKKKKKEPKARSARATTTPSNRRSHPQASHASGTPPPASPGPGTTHVGNMNGFEMDLGSHLPPPTMVRLL